MFGEVVGLSDIRTSSRNFLQGGGSLETSKQRKRTQKLYLLLNCSGCANHLNFFSKHDRYTQEVKFLLYFVKLSSERCPNGKVKMVVPFTSNH